jgi:tungstate transport system ATP-binding protein
MPRPILTVNQLIKSREDGFALEVPALEFVEGKIYGVVGPNGAGKTTLLNVLGFLEEPSKGSVSFRGEEVDISKRSIITIRRHMHMVMENPLLFNTTVFNNVASGLKIRSIEKAKWPQMVGEALEVVGLQGFEKRHAHTLSRGETQRVAIARALVVKPQVLFLDEPFTNIDKGNTAIIENVIRTINGTYSTTIILTTHDLHQAYRLSDEVISLVDGKIVRGSLENFFVGEVEEIDHTTWVRVSPSVKISVVTDTSGRVRIAVPPQDIIVSRERLDSSARNSFRGLINKIHLEGETVRLGVAIDSEVEFVVLITKASFEEMDFSPGRPVYLTFKSTSVVLF